jgi:soluble lytic murein transglycosylase-like protein
MRNSLWMIFLVVFCLSTNASGFCFKQAADRYRISSELLIAIARVESDLNPSAFNQNENGSYDCGLMQINSCWKQRLGCKWRQISDPCYNVMVGSWILKDCMNRYGYSWDAVACYHTGKGLSDTSEKSQNRGMQYIQKIQLAMRNPP